MYQSILILRGPPKLIHNLVTTIPETAVPIGKKGFLDKRQSSQSYFFASDRQAQKKSLHLQILSTIPYLKHEFAPQPQTLTGERLSEPTRNLIVLLLLPRKQAGRNQALGDRKKGSRP